MPTEEQIVDQDVAGQLNEYKGSDMGWYPEAGQALEARKELLAANEFLRGYSFADRVRLGVER